MFADYHVPVTVSITEAAAIVPVRECAVFTDAEARPVITVAIVAVVAVNVDLGRVRERRHANRNRRRGRQSVNEFLHQFSPPSTRGQQMPAREVAGTSEKLS